MGAFDESGLKMSAVAAAASLAGAAINVGGGILTAKKNRKAAKEMQAAQIAEARRQQEANQRVADQGATGVTEAYNQASSALKYYSALAQKAFTEGDERAANIYQQKAAEARQSMSAGYSRSREALSPMTSLSHYGEDALTGKGFETSGGYQFRLGEGQNALDRMGAASGGRLSGAALKAASQYNQGFASNEYNNWANRASNLGTVGYNAQGRLSDLYSQEGVNQSNLTRDEGGYLSGLYQNAGTRTGNLQNTLGAGLSSLATGGATAAANIRSGNAALNTGLTGNMMSAYQQPTGAGGEWKAISDFGGNLATLGAAYMGQEDPNAGNVHWDAATQSWLPGNRA